MSRLLMLLVAGLKFGKLSSSVLSMLVVVGLYALAYGWRYAVGVVAMLFIHEMGHYIAARQRGLAVRMPMFIPFVGAVTSYEASHDAETTAYIALAGPLLGTLGALACYFLGQSQHVPWLLAIAYTGFLINLFNLIPVPPFDGGQITQVLSPRIWLLGLPILGVMMWYRFSPLLLVIAILAAPYAWRALRWRQDDPAVQAHYAVRSRVRWEYAFYYAVLVVFLAMMMQDTREQLDPRAHRDDATQSESV